MINLIIATHGEMSKSILDLSKMVLGEYDNIEAVTFMPGEGTEDLISKYNKSLEKFNNVNGTLFLVDLFGGSPYNAASMVVLESNNMDVVTGINVPMLLELLDAREGIKDVSILVEIAKESGAAGIKSFNETFKNVNVSENEENLSDEEDEELEGL